MAFDGKSLDDYNDVASRLAEFRKDHPDGRIRPADPAMPYHVVRVPNGWCVRCKGAQVIKQGDNWKKCPRCEGSGVRHRDEPQEDVFIVYASAVHRDPTDQLPGIGMAWERYPGRTPYTSDSELMNAETSAIGRALIAALAADSRKGVASKDEVRNRAADRDEDGWPADTQPPARRAQRGPVPPEQDHWTGQPAGQLPNGANPEERTGSIDGRQRSLIMAHLGKLPRPDRVAKLGELAGRVVESTNDLSWVEADKVIKAIDGEVKAAAKEKEAAS